jgi:hypothetical protein
VKAAWIIGIIAGLLGIFAVHLSQRVVELERRVAALEPLEGDEPVASKENAGGLPNTTGRAPVEKRLEAIEDDLAQLQEDYAGLDQQLAAGGGTPGAPDEARILDVVTRAQNRVRDRQLEFHVEHWKRTRSQLLDHFAEQTKLERWQTEQLRELLDHELDAWFELYTRPEMIENPERAAEEWQRQLDETDLEAVRLLDPLQKSNWHAARYAERQTLWPWLPSLQKQSAK